MAAPLGPPRACRSKKPGGNAGPVAIRTRRCWNRIAGETNLSLPRISADGRAPMAAYAAGFDPSSRRPRVGILIAGHRNERS